MFDFNLLDVIELLLNLAIQIYFGWSKQKNPASQPDQTINQEHNHVD